MIKIIPNRNCCVMTMVFALFTVMVCNGQPKIVFDSLEYTMPPVKKGTSATLDIPFKNAGDQPLIITRINGTGVPVVSSTKEPIPPNGSGIITFKMPTNFTGTTKQHLYVQTNIDDKIILLKVTLTIYEDKRMVSGIVRYSDGGPLPGVWITVDGTQRTVASNFDGYYSIEAAPDEFLTFNYAGMKVKKIKADRLQTDVTLEENTDLPYVGPPPGPTGSYRKESLSAGNVKFTEEYIEKEIRNRDNPRYHFKKDRKQEVFIIYISGAPPVESLDTTFQKKYKIFYSPDANQNIRYRQRYNKMVFKYLTKKYKEIWKQEIRKDAIGLESVMK